MRTVVAAAVVVDVVLARERRPIVQVVLVPEVMAVDLAALLLADRDVLEAGQVEVAPVVELPEPELEDQLLPGVARVAGAALRPPDARAPRPSAARRRPPRAARGSRAPPRAGCPRAWSDRGGSCRTAPCTDRRCAACAPGCCTSANRRCSGSRAARSSTLTKPRAGSPASSIGDRGNAARGLVDVPDALIDRVPRGGAQAGGNGQSASAAAAPRRARTARRPSGGEPRLAHVSARFGRRVPRPSVISRHRFGIAAAQLSAGAQSIPSVAPGASRAATASAASAGLIGSLAPRRCHERHGACAGGACGEA